jgi:gamma-glutamylcyclotransferase (GGCT)/AIG2-like uncharacterized protein YtfP
VPCEQSVTSIPRCPYLAVYGTLRRQFIFRQGIWVTRNLRFEGHGVVRGRLFRQRGYPGLIDSPGLVSVEIYQIKTAETWEWLDRYEGCDLNDPERSLFYRRIVPLFGSGRSAWVYYLRRQIPLGPEATPRSPGTNGPARWP